METATKTFTFTIKSNPEERDNIYNLAKRIASIPQNHDEYEVVIADEIKRYVHGEKLSVVLWNACYAEPHKYPEEKHLQWFADTCLKLKVETHEKLYSSWRYGSPHTCRPFMTDETEISKILKGVHDEELFGYYMAGTLDAQGFVLNQNGFAPTEGYFSREEGDIPYNDTEKYWWAKCYVKYKTPDHSFYKESENRIRIYEARKEK